jgi:hypothetical protein
MITLLIGTSLLAGIGFGWYGHKAKLRIDIWGKNEQAQDLIFQVAEGGKTLENSWKRVPGDASPLAPFTAAPLSQ